jgi:hypothetical protein
MSTVRQCLGLKRGELVESTGVEIRNSAIIRGLEFYLFRQLI